MDKDKTRAYKDRTVAITSAMKQEVVKRHSAWGVDEEKLWKGANPRSAR